MSIKDKIAAYQRTADFYIEALDATITVAKLTLVQAEKLKAFAKKVNDDPVSMLAEIASNYLTEDGEPILDPKTAKQDAENMPGEIVVQLVDAFHAVNDFGKKSEKN